MNLRIHENNPADAVEMAFFRVRQERMADLPIVNPALSVEAVDFQRWQEHWLGILVTPWCMSILLVPGGAENWITPAAHERRFVTLPAGNFAFLRGDEAELGEYLSCSLFSPMDRFSSQLEATMTARAAMVALLTPAGQCQAPAAAEQRSEQPSLSRRRFLTLR